MVADGGDHYLIPGTQTLKNKLGITDADALSQLEYQLAEANSFILFESGRAIQPAMQGWKTVHKVLFCDLYDWAGCYRDLYLSRQFEGGSSKFSAVENIEKDGERAFKGLKAAMRHFDKNDVAWAARHLADAYIMLNSVHPFREGNGRSQKVLFSLICRPFNMSLDWAAIPVEEHYKAAIAGHQNDPTLMREHFAKMITKSSAPALSLPK